ncbi:hypothetical protein TNCV_516531 [Trichonephila clavipes]|nr:hypothetical protein TNCV_516531 [Trichonephila clavipes]
MKTVKLEEILSKPFCYKKIRYTLQFDTGSCFVSSCVEELAALNPGATEDPPCRGHSMHVKSVEAPIVRMRYFEEASPGVVI